MPDDDLQQEKKFKKKISSISYYVIQKVTVEVVIAAVVHSVFLPCLLRCCTDILCCLIFIFVIFSYAALGIVGECVYTPTHTLTDIQLAWGKVSSISVFLQCLLWWIYTQTCKLCCYFLSHPSTVSMCVFASSSSLFSLVVQWVVLCWPLWEESSKTRCEGWSRFHYSDIPEGK